ncbi:MAG TPA: hypothetical protein VFV70_00805 [Hyphomonadaceae bacterium]|nr:hypothetical protein [Hyphomonadaceae bacterium]
MIASLAGSFVFMSCLGCTQPANDAVVTTSDVGPVQGGQSFRSSTKTIDSTFAASPQTDFALPLKVGNDFSPSNWARPVDAARFEALDLSTPMPVRTERGNLWSAEVSFGASAERTGLGLDFSITPRAQIQRDQAGNDVSRTGAEVRLGTNLVDRDQRGTNAPAPSWYFFVGADNEALVWNVADKRAVNGVALRDQATVGDLQAGVAWTVQTGGQMSIGIVERELRFNDIAGDNDIERKDHFAAFSFTLRH